MADGTLPYQNPTTIDELLDTESLTVGLNTVHRERVVIAGTGATQIAPVSATDGLLVNLGANNDVTVTGSVTANAGTNLNTSALNLEATQSSVLTSVQTIDNIVGAQGSAAGSGVSQQGLEARTTLPTTVSDGQAVRSMADDMGRQVVLNAAPRELQVTHALTLSGSTEVVLLGAGTSGIYHDLTMVTVANTLSSNATITFRSALAAAARFYLYAPGQNTVGFATPTPVVQTTAASSWTAQADHGAGGLQIFVQAIKAK